MTLPRVLLLQMNFMIFLGSILLNISLFTFHFAQAEEFPQCPEGSKKIGKAPPDGNKVLCVKQDEEDDEKYVLHGPRVLWYPNGGLKQVAEYKNGKLDGKKIDYGIRGNQLQSWTYREGLPHGKHTIYHPDGKVRQVTEYRLGKIVRPKKPPARPRKKQSPKLPPPTQASSTQSEKPKPVAPESPPEKAPIEKAPKERASKEEASETSKAPAPPPKSYPVTTHTLSLRCQWSSQALEEQIKKDIEAVLELTRTQLKLDVSPTQHSLILIRKIRKSEDPDRPLEAPTFQLKIHTAPIRYRLVSNTPLGIAKGGPGGEIEGDIRKKQSGARILYKKTLQNLRDLLKGFEAHQKMLADLGVYGNLVTLRPESLKSETNFEVGDLQTQEVKTTQIDLEVFPSSFYFSKKNEVDEIQIRDCQTIR